VPSFCRAAGKESGESLLGKGGGLGNKPAASNVAEGHDFCIKFKLCRIPIVDFRAAAAGDDRFSEGSWSLVVFPDSDYRGVYNPSGASLVLSKQTVGLHDGTLWYFILDRLICSLYIGFCGLLYYVMRSLNIALYPNYLPALFEVLMQSFEIIVRQGLLHGDLAKRAKHFFTESARVCAGIDAWSSGNLEAFGKLMSQSGLSSIHNYECGECFFLVLIMLHTYFWILS
jgi:hypothetical protein